MFDFHTHTIKDGNTPCLLNIPLSCYDHINDCLPNPNIVFSVGLHPWDVSEDWEEKIEAIQRGATHDRVWAIGECGLDKICGASFDLQLKAFHAQITIAETLRKPMVIHCVKAFNELLAARKETDAENRRHNRQSVPWVIHGFRGKPNLANQLMSKGLLLSFGHSYNTYTLRKVFASCKPFFLETDDNNLSIGQIYEQVALELSVDVVSLDARCNPYQTIFMQ